MSLEVVKLDSKRFSGEVGPYNGDHLWIDAITPQLEQQSVILHRNKSRCEVEEGHFYGVWQLERIACVFHKSMEMEIGRQAPQKAKLPIREDIFFTDSITEPRKLNFYITK